MPLIQRFLEKIDFIVRSKCKNTGTLDNLFSYEKNGYRLFWWLQACHFKMFSLN